MRLATFDTQWLLDTDGTLLGIQGGSDCAAEHEWGIAGLSREFGRDQEALGLERTRIRRVPDRLVRVTHEGAHGLFLPKGTESYYKQPEGYAKDWRGTLSRKGLAFGWDEGSFGFWDGTPQGEARVGELHEAFKRLDISIGGGAGLTFKILSRIPKQEIAESKAKDLDLKALKKAAEATGIEDVLRAAGRAWYALSPRWADSTKTSVAFWLNPQDQHLHNSGWFTVEDLKLWAQGKGPVMQRGGRRASR